MKKNVVLPLIIFATLLFSSNAFGFNNLDDVVEVQQYTRAIHIMAMLLVGFGFLMVFVKNYGRSALTATFLLVSVAIPFYFLVADAGWFIHEKSQIEMLILAEFAAAGLLIASGAVLGRMKMYQYIILALLFVPFYMFNEWAILDNGLGLISGKFADTGGSIIIHAFGALFGLGVAIAMTKKKELEIPIEADATSDRYSMLGSMVLWIFWPSFCAALVPTADIPNAVINVIFALSGSTLATYIMSVWLRGKINIADIANAALAGGVAIGATVDFATHPMALLIGVMAGVLSTAGFALLQSRQQKALKAIDTCGVTNLHGLPGLMGGFAAIFVVKGINTGSQVIGILFTVVTALITGYITGKIISLFGHRKRPYEDKVEFEDA
ncbi:MAG: ammonium transporter [Candidatus Delongbacteria bacterium]|jgi:ammonium transporter Rh|nr:ammonium transporter [Candidatus Delongbacteria bacterium]